VAETAAIAHSHHHRVIAHSTGLGSLLAMAIGDTVASAHCLMLLEQIRDSSSIRTVTYSLTHEDNQATIASVLSDRLVLCLRHLDCMIRAPQKHGIALAPHRKFLPPMTKSRMHELRMISVRHVIITTRLSTMMAPTFATHLQMPALRLGRPWLRSCSTASVFLLGTAVYGKVRRIMKHIAARLTIADTLFVASHRAPSVKLSHHKALIIFPLHAKPCLCLPKLRTVR